MTGSLDPPEGVPRMLEKHGDFLKDLIGRQETFFFPKMLITLRMCDMHVQRRDCLLQDPLVRF